MGFTAPKFELRLCHRRLPFIGAFLQQRVLYFLMLLAGFLNPGEWGNL
jgi:hypothetical protein